MKEWKRNHAREAAQERSRGGQINLGAGVSEADMLAASAVGRRHGLLLASAKRAAKELEQEAQVPVSGLQTKHTASHTLSLVWCAAGRRGGPLLASADRAARPASAQVLFSLQCLHLTVHMIAGCICRHRSLLASAARVAKELEHLTHSRVSVFGSKKTHEHVYPGCLDCLAASVAYAICCGVTVLSFPLQAEQAAERQRQQDAEEAVRHAELRAIGHDAQPPAPEVGGPVVPGNVLDPRSTAAAAAAVAAAAAPQQQGRFGKAGRGRSYSNGADDDCLWS